MDNNNNGSGFNNNNGQSQNQGNEQNNNTQNQTGGWQYASPQNQSGGSQQNWQYSGQPDFNNPNSFNVNPQPAKDTLGIVAMSLGIFAIVCACCCQVVGILAGIAAIICAVMSKNSTGSFSGYAKAGLICGIAGTVLCVISLVVVIILYVGGALDSIFTESYYYNF